MFAKSLIVGIVMALLLGQAHAAGFAVCKDGTCVDSASGSYVGTAKDGIYTLLDDTVTEGEQLRNSNGECLTVQCQQWENELELLARDNSLKE